MGGCTVFIIHYILPTSILHTLVNFLFSVYFITDNGHPTGTLPYIP